MTQKVNDTSSESHFGDENLFSSDKTPDDINFGVVGNASATVSGCNTKVKPSSKLFWILKPGSHCDF